MYTHFKTHEMPKRYLHYPLSSDGRNPEEFLRAQTNLISQEAQRNHLKSRQEELGPQDQKRFTICSQQTNTHFQSSLDLMYKTSSTSQVWLQLLEKKLTRQKPITGMKTNSLKIVEIIQWLIGKELDADRSRRVTILMTKYIIFVNLSG